MEANVEKMKEVFLEEEGLDLGPECWVEFDLTERGKDLPG